MAKIPPTKSDRDKNIQAIQRAVKDWADKEVKRLDNEVKFLKAVMQGRGSGSAAAKNLADTTAVAVSQINDFILYGQ